MGKHWKQRFVDVSQQISISCAEQVDPDGRNALTTCFMVVQIVDSKAES